MNRYNYFLLLLALLFVSCKQDVTVPESDMHLLEFEIGFQEQELTRTTVIPGTSFVHESKIEVGIFANGNGVGSNTSLDNHATYIYKNPIGAIGSWIPFSSSKKLGAKEWDMEVLACYPFTTPVNWATKIITPEIPVLMDLGDLLENYNSGDSYLVEFEKGKTTEVLLANKEVDYLTGAGTNGPYNKEKLKVNITMRHALSMVVFHVYKSPENVAPGHVKSITIQNVNALTGPLHKGSFAMLDNKFTASTDRTSYKRTVSNAPDGCNFGFMIYPVDIAMNEVEVLIEVDNVTYKLMVLKDSKWESGKIFLYNIKLNPTGAELLDLVEVADWPSLKPEYTHDFDIS